LHLTAQERVIDEDVDGWLPISAVSVSVRIC